MVQGDIVNEGLYLLIVLININLSMILLNFLSRITKFGIEKEIIGEKLLM